MKKIKLLLVILNISLLGISQTTIEITAPNGGESFEPGETINIDYTVNDGLEYDSPEIHYSTDGGATYNWIAAAPTLPTSPPAIYTDSYSWTIPGIINSTECLIRVRLHRGGVGYVSTDFSDDEFTIQPPVTGITVVSPNGGESYEPGESINIDYTFVNGEINDDLIFYYSTNNGVTYSPLGSFLFSTVPPASYSGTMTWDIPLGIDSPVCLIRSEVHRTSGGIGVVANDTTDNVFAIQPPSPVILLTSPNGGETLVAGESIYVHFQFENGQVSDDLVFSYSVDGGVTYDVIGNIGYTAAPMAVEVDSILWDIPDGISSNNCYIACEIDRGVLVEGSDTSDNSFTINLPANITDNIFSEVSIYPNPFKGEVNINLGNLKGTSINVYNAFGKLIYQVNDIDSQDYQLNLDLEAGVYYIELENNTELTNYKVIKSD